MKDGTIRLSKKHGLAPVLCSCPVCGEDSGEIALLGALADKLPNFRGSIGERVPGSICTKCAKLLADGAVALLSEKTGRAIMFTREGAQKLFKGNPQGVLVATEDLFDRVASMLPVGGDV